MHRWVVGLDDVQQDLRRFGWVSCLLAVLALPKTANGVKNDVIVLDATLCTNHRATGPIGSK